MSYVPQIDEDDEAESDSTQQDISTLNQQGYDEPEIQGGLQRIARERLLFKNRWPKALGIAQTTVGFITVMLSLTEIFIVPAFESPKDFSYPRIDLSNSFAAGVWSGFMLIMTGSTALRASISRRATTVYRYMLFTVFTIVVYVAAAVIIVYGYSSQSTTRDAFKAIPALYPVHIFVTIIIFIGLVLTLTAFVTYYEDILFGDLQLFHRFWSCVVCRFCIADVERESGQNQGESVII